MVNVYGYLSEVTLVGKQDGDNIKICSLCCAEF
jgi:hypothetical protein